MKIRELAYCALFIALLIICSQIQINLGLVVYTLQTLAVLLICFLLPTKLAVISTGTYLLLGLIGLPVFAGWKGGLSALVSPTFGFIISFVVVALVIPPYLEKLGYTRRSYIIASVLATLIIYGIGLTYFAFIMNVQQGQEMSLMTIFSLVTLPYIPGDIVKAILAIIIGTRLHKHTFFLKKA